MSMERPMVSQGIARPSRRRDRLHVRPSDGPWNSLQYIWRHVNPLRVVINFLIIYTCRFVPWLGVKNRLYRLTGMKVGEHTSIALMAMMDVFFPEEISIGSNTIIGYNTTILGHEYLLNEWRHGPVVIGDNVTIGANCTILPGVIVGDGAVVSAMSLVNRDVPPGAWVGGVPIRPLSRSSAPKAEGRHDAQGG
ncbi:MAG: acyltransferase [Anaerolineae bacterium]|nr:acyltransferase [Anaerolineae bacterium]